MNLRKKLNSIFSTSVSKIFLLSFVLFISACLPNPSAVRKSLLNSTDTTTAKAPTKLPDFTQGNNYVQNGGSLYTSVVGIDINFADVLQLRGKDVDGYIRNFGTQTISCLSAKFKSSTVNQIIVMAAIPHSIYNFTNQTLEYYYSVAPNDDITNKNFCQKTGLINKLYSLYPALTLNYKLSALCVSGNCVSSSFTSLPFELYSQSGSIINQIATAQLSFSLTNNPNLSTPTGQTCSINSECKSLGYDCCSLGQCVKDLALKPGVDQTSVNYVQALADILNNPSHIYSYPQYYYLCSSAVTTPTGPTAPVNSVNTAIARLQSLTDLYNCTTKVEGEMGICTKTISNAQLSVFYSAGSDDRNFSSTYTNQDSSSYTTTSINDLTTLQEISYGGVTLFNYDQLPNESTLRPEPAIVSEYLTFNGQHNDDASSGAAVKLTKFPSNTTSQDLVIKYKIDASCIQLSSTLAKCEKYYVQGQQKSGDTIDQNRRGRVTDHYPASNSFKLPYYANTSKSIIVQVDGITQKQDSDWQLSTNGNTASVDFFPSSSGGISVYDSQKVKLTFFVDLTINKVMDSKIAALTKIKETCQCPDLNCSLAPLKDIKGNITDYSCIYPDPAPVTPPVSQIVYLSSKTVPVRYFDSSGTSKAAINGSTLPQEGTAFSYRNNDLLNPNNTPDPSNPAASDNYIGFNEIYGSLSYANSSAKPAKEIPVTKGKIYDIYVDNGSYSNCILCGNDYYSQLNKLFPLAQFGGGITPLQSRTDRTQANGIRGDDMSFGRACFVPATMLPWSHSVSSGIQDQRMNRMRAQHFFYANGYQHDWYGFDYGAVIGSFDGVKWFAIGSNRRITADTNKLFIAVNGPFGDLAIETTYTVTVNDGSLNPMGANMTSKDIDSDGAECQKFHQCSTDNDCATTLGWDYACANVNEITTSWPKFDDNAKEIPDASREDNKLVNILGQSSSGKRCVYRGRGAACSQNYLSSVLDTALTYDDLFNLTNIQNFHACSSNNYCQSLSSNNTLNPNFNNRIARYAKVRTDPQSDSFGLGAKVIGRPMEFNAQETVRSETIRNLNTNKITGVCIPGRNPEIDNFIGQNSTAPIPAYMGDKVTGIGMSYKKSTTVPTPTYLASCSIMDDTNNYFSMSSTTPNTSFSTDTNLINQSATQAISTNALDIFTSIFNQKNISYPIYRTNSLPLLSFAYTENRCLRAPGASCFSDTECAPSKMIADKIKQLSTDDQVVLDILNKYEVKFWQEDLICSQATLKSDPTYSPSKNRCCRDVGKIISLPSASIENPIEMDQAPGVDVNMSYQYRYSRVATMYKDHKNDPTTYPNLSVPVTDQCSLATGCADIATITNQFRTFSSFAEKTSCSGDWVRSFANGNHRWDSTRLVQTFNPSLFKCMNWLPGETGNGKQWDCSGLTKDDPACNMIQTPANSAKAKAVMNYFAKLELMGIPQIALESEEYFNTDSEGDLSCRSFPNNQNGCYPNHPDPEKCKYVTDGAQNSSLTNYAFPVGLFKDHFDSASLVNARNALSTAQNTPTAANITAATNAANLSYANIKLAITASAEYIDTSANKHLYSAADITNYQSPIKQIFKADEVTTCFQAGTVMQVGADPNLCCTGFINAKTNKCQLDDFVDVSLYTNRYISSEAKNLNPTLFDSNGYISDPSYAAKLACQKSMCASGVVAYGVLISNLKIPGQEAIDNKKTRFLQGSVAADDENGLLGLYNKGLKFNNHVYCFPSTNNSNSSDVVTRTCQ